MNNVDNTTGQIAISMYVTAVEEGFDILYDNENAVYNTVTTDEEI